MVKFCSMHVCNLGLVHTASGGALCPICNLHIIVFSDIVNITSPVTVCFCHLPAHRRVASIIIQDHDESVYMLLCYI